MPAANGTTDFSVLQNELRSKSKKIVMVAFDLLYLNGCDLRKLPPIERKALLKKSIAGTDVQFSESFEDREMYQHACSIGPEGVVSKVRDKYNSGRSNDWLKTTCARRETLPIAGFSIKDNEFDGLYVGRQKGDSLIYAGKVDYGFDKVSVKDLQARTLISGAAVGKRPQDPNLDGTGLQFETLDHGGEYPDTMRQAIKLIDAEGRSYIYALITQNGKVVDSQGYVLDLEDE